MTEAESLKTECTFPYCGCKPTPHDCSLIPAAPQNIGESRVKLTVTKLICDRCHATADGPAIDWVGLEYKSTGRPQSEPGALFELSLDLCNTCRLAFNAFLAGARAT